jgi:hypothetical protein
MVHKINGKHVTPTHHLTIWKRIAIGVIADGTVMGIGSVIGGAILVVGSLVLSTRVRKPVLVIVAERRAHPVAMGDTRGLAPRVVLGGGHKQVGLRGWCYSGVMGR